MTSRHERRAAALEAIAQGLLELAAVEREPEEKTPQEVLIDRRNCDAERGLHPTTFVAAAGREFSAFRVARRLTATKADVLTWLKSRKVRSKERRQSATTKLAQDPDELLTLVHARFVAGVGRPMTDDELDRVDMWIELGRQMASDAGHGYTHAPDDLAARAQASIGQEPFRHRFWRSLGLDPTTMERDAEKLRQQLSETNPEMGWRDRVQAVGEMWGAITEPLSEGRRATRAALRAAKKAERAKLGQLGLKT